MKRYSIWIGVLAGAAFIVWLLYSFVFSSYLILSPDMKETMLPGERIIVNKWAYGLRLPYMQIWGYHRVGEAKVQKGDVVVFNDPLKVTEALTDHRPLLVYRCLAGPGDTISVDSCRLVIPHKGQSIAIDRKNSTFFCNMLRLHEKKQAIVRHDTLFIDGKSVRSCTFTQDYYWMVSDNVPNVTDSHLFGLVPADHIIGKALFVWFSKDPKQNLFNGYRWERFFHIIK